MNTWSAITPIWPKNAEGPTRKKLTSKSEMILAEELLRRVCVIRSEMGDVLVCVKEIKDGLATWLVREGETLTLPSPIFTGALYAVAVDGDAEIVVTWFKAVE